MKRLSILLVSLAIFLCACMPQDTVPDPPIFIPTDTPAEFPNETVPTEDSIVEEKTEYIQHPMTAVSLPAITETTYSDDGSVLFQYTHQNMHLVVQDQEIADRVIIDFLNRVDTYHSVADYVNDLALTNYSQDMLWNSYFCDLEFQPTRIDNSVLSLFGVCTFYYGGNHPEFECHGANYNMITGDVLTLGSILYNIDSFVDLQDLVVLHAEKVATEANLFEDYPEIIYERFNREESYDEDWYFTSTGLAFYFAPYEIAPYRSGIITIEVPYNELYGIIADDYFPPEEIVSQGIISAQFLSDTNLEQFTQIAEVILEESGDYIFLSCDGLVRDVQIDVGIWDDVTGSFESIYTAFATYVLSPGDGIMVQTAVDNDASIIRVSYRSGTETVYAYLHLSAPDGTVSLQPLY